MINFFRNLLFKKREAEPGLVYTWNGLNPEVIKNNWRPGDEYWVLVWWKHFNAQSVYLDRKIQQDVTKGDLQEEETMNTNIDTPEFKPVPTQLKFTDKELEQLLENKPFDGGTVYITDADETADEPAAPTIH